MASRWDYIRMKMKVDFNTNSLVGKMILFSNTNILWVSLINISGIIAIVMFKKIGG